MSAHLLPRQLLVLMDFTSVALADKPGGSAIVQDCILVLQYKDGDRTITCNLDFLCTHSSNKHDYYFVLQVWLDLFVKEKLKERFDRIDVWSDGGPHHFKTRYCQCMWHLLSQVAFCEKAIAHHFYPSYHGHSLADGHAGHVKSVIDKAYKLSELQRVITPLTATFGPSTIEEVAALIRNNSSNTTVTVFDAIDRSSDKPNVRAVPSIKSKHYFLYEGGIAFASEAKGEGDICWIEF